MWVGLIQSGEGLIRTAWLPLGNKEFCQQTALGLELATLPLVSSLSAYRIRFWTWQASTATWANNLSVCMYKHIPYWFNISGEPCLIYPSVHGYWGCCPFSWPHSLAFFSTWPTKIFCQTKATPHKNLQFGMEILGQLHEGCSTWVWRQLQFRDQIRLCVWLQVLQLA